VVTVKSVKWGLVTVNLVGKPVQRVIGPQESKPPERPRQAAVRQCCPTHILNRAVESLYSAILVVMIR
jgi:hypothetical protein